MRPSSGSQAWTSEATVPRASIGPAANDIGAIVVDKYHSSHIIIREDMTMADFDNVTKYALQPTVVSRFCVAEPVDSDKSTVNNKGATVRVKLTS